MLSAENLTGLAGSAGKEIMFHPAESGMDTAETEWKRR